MRDRKLTSAGPTVEEFLSILSTDGEFPDRNQICGLARADRAVAADAFGLSVVTLAGAPVGMLIAILEWAADTRIDR